MRQRKVTLVKPKIRLTADQPADFEKQKKRVAAYARVSTDMDEQLTSYEAQVDYYTKHIQENPDWSFVKVYAMKAFQD